MNRRRETTWLAAVVAVGLAARLAFVAFVDTKPSFSGGDGGFYLTVAQNLANGYGFVYGRLATYRTEPVLTAGPLYPAYLSLFYVLFGGYQTHPIHDPPFEFTRGAPWILAARLGQAGFGVLAILSAWLLARRLWGPRAGLLAAGVMALDPRFIVETGAVYTETMFTGLLLCGLAVYLVAHQNAVARRRTPGPDFTAPSGSATRVELPASSAGPSQDAGLLASSDSERTRLMQNAGRVFPAVWIDARWYVLAWFVLSLAALARPIAVLIFPLLCLHLWLCRPPAQALRQTLGLAGILALVAAPIVARHYLLYGNLELVGSSAASHFWLGAIRDGQWGGLEDFVEQKLAIAGGDPDNPPYLRAALAVIAENPLRFLQLLALKLARAYLQPMGTVFFVGPSLKTMLGDVLAGRLGLGALLADPTFWPKAAIYLFHFGAIGLGLAALWRNRARWPETLVPLLAILGFSGAYMLLTLIPRYIFPIMPCFTVLAAEPLAALLRRPALARSPAVPPGLAPLPDQPYREGRA